MIIKRVCWRYTIWCYGTLGFLEKTHERSQWHWKRSIVAPPQVEVEMDYQGQDFRVICLNGNRNAQLRGQVFYVPREHAFSFQVEDPGIDWKFSMDRGYYLESDEETTLTEATPSTEPLTVAVAVASPPLRDELSAAELQRASVMSNIANPARYAINQPKKKK